MTERTCIQAIKWLVCWNAKNRAHQYLRDAYLLYVGDEIVEIGTGAPPQAHRTVDGTDLMVMPGLVNLHSHPYGELGYRGLREEHGVPAMFMTGLYERLQAFSLSESGQRASAEATFAELLMSGVTTLVDISSPYEGWTDLLARSGLRVYAAVTFASARHVMRDGYQIDYDWSPDGGRKSYEQACTLMDDIESHPSERLRAMVSPSTLDDVTETLLRESRQLADATNRPYTVHAAESVLEVRNMIERTGKTSIQWAADLGLLGEHCILGHSLFLDEHSWIQWHSRRDLSLLAESGASVAHCPTPFSRYGHMLEHFGKYVDAGVNMGIGTDTLPANMVDEIRTATVLAKIAARHVDATSLADVFYAATVGGAKALGREDIGRLAVGAKADFVTVDLKHPYMRPVRDPLRSLFFSAGERAIRDVYIGGRRVVADGEPQTIRHQDALERLEAAQSEMIGAVAEQDYLGRNVDEIAPLCLPIAVTKS